MGSCRSSICSFLLILVLLALVQTAFGRSRHYKWQVNYLLRSPDCVESVLIAINEGFPGPTIQAEAGDTIVVELENKLPTEGVVIHWHGIRQRGTPWSDGTASVTQCAINPGETYVYRFVVDKPGTYFYHAHHGMQRSAGLYGLLIVDVGKGEKEPFPFDGELNIIVSDWWHKSIYEQMTGLHSKPFRWIGEPQSLLIGGRGHYNCSLVPTQAGTISANCNNKNHQCEPFILSVEAGKTYRVRIASATALSSLNFIIEGHNMLLVEAGGNYIEPVEVENVDIYSGQTYSFLVKADQDPSRNYWAAVNVRGRRPNTPPGLAIFNYIPNQATSWPSTAPPASPAWNDFAYSKAFANKIVARDGFGPRVPPKSDRTIVLLNTQNYIDGYTKWAINNVSLVLPVTPYLAALKYKLRNAFDHRAAPETYSPNGYDIMRPPSNPNAVTGNSVYSLNFNATVDVVLQNANVLTPNSSDIHPWHLHGHDFWVLAYGDGAFIPSQDVGKFNLRNPPLQNTVVVFPYGWTAIRFVADNAGAWAFHCHIEPHLHMGMGVVFAEGIEMLGKLPRSGLGCGGTKTWLP